MKKQIILLTILLSGCHHAGVLPKMNVKIYNKSNQDLKNIELRLNEDNFASPKIINVSTFAILAKNDSSALYTLNLKEYSKGRDGVLQFFDGAGKSLDLLNYSNNRFNLDEQYMFNTIKVVVTEKGSEKSFAKY